MNSYLNGIRKPQERGTKAREILASFGVLGLGIALGLFAKWLDALAIDDTIPWQHLLGLFDLNNVFSDFGVWMMLATIISVKSRSPVKAAINVLLFFIGMTVSYHWYSVHVCGFDPAGYMKIWYALTAVSPLLAAVCWYAQGDHRISRILKIMIFAVIFLVTIGKRYWDISIYRLPDIVIVAVTAIILFGKKK